MLDENDHRSLGQRLNLFHFQEEAPGMVFWRPRGLILYRLLQDRVRQQLQRDDYLEVRTPQLLNQAIWRSSGHWQNFREDMFVLGEDDAAALKPVSCPGHIQIVQRMAPSYRDLPLRLSEFGLVHRNEQSGVLHGLFRLRQFTQDDGHVFCEEGQVHAEVARFCGALKGFYQAFGFVDLDIAFSSRPPQRAGDDSVWERAEAMLEDAARKAGLQFSVQPGQGAFYGPKLEFSLKDRLGRAWQCGTIQLDFVLPERFDLAYVDSSGGRRRPAMLHRALFGSVERFLGVLLEHYSGALPPWLAPEQTVVVPVSAHLVGHARAVAHHLSASGIRARINAGPDTLARRIVEAHQAGIPFVVVVGKRELAEGSINIRDRSGRQWETRLEDGVRELVRLCAPPAFTT
jgi:threonyl-tRNA synthetase